MSQSTSNNARELFMPGVTLAFFAFAALALVDHVPAGLISGFGIAALSFFLARRDAARSGMIADQFLRAADETVSNTTAPDPECEIHALRSETHELRLDVRAANERDVILEEEAARADEDTGAFLTAVSHELRNPLNSILGFADVLLQEIDGPLNEGQREDVHAIRSSGQHLRSLFSDIIDLSAAVSNRLALRRGRTPLLPIVRAVKQELDIVKADTVELRIAIGDLPDLDADPKRVRQIVQNLGGNAVKFTESGDITFGARRDGDFVLFYVRDTGVGIAPAHLKEIFQDFIHAPKMRSRHGAGLGLAISKRLAELHGGRVAVKSRLGEGSTFTVWLPIYSENAPSEPEA